MIGCGHRTGATTIPPPKGPAFERAPGSIQLARFRIQLFCFAQRAAALQLQGTNDRDDSEPCCILRLYSAHSRTVLTEEPCLGCSMDSELEGAAGIPSELVRSGRLHYSPVATIIGNGMRN